jgi:hypothetical protein
MSKYDKQLDRMLARGRLSPDDLGPVVERAVSGKPDEAPPKSVRRPWRWALIPSLSFGVVASLFLVITNPFSSEEFRNAKLSTVLSAECAAPCTAGSQLVFKVGRHEVPGYLAAYATSGDTRVWFHPAEDAQLPRVEPSKEDLTSVGAATIGKEQRPGKWIVHTILLREPLTREQIQSLSGDRDARLLGRSRAPLTIAPE